MITIKLRKGLEAWVDDEDKDLIAPYNWYAIKMRNTHYVRATIPKSMLKEGQKQGTKVYLHRLVMGEPKDLMVDHIDRNGLNCQKENLRIVTNAENQLNRESAGGSSKYKGVYAARNGWTMEINTGKVMKSGNVKIITITGFHTEEGAAKKYDKLAKKYHGEFARLNFKEE